jgi:hypothetical protein
LVLVLGLLLVVVGVVLLLDLGGAAGFVIRHLTARSLGELAPGYAASRHGFRVYASLILFIGTMALGIAVSPIATLPGVIGIAAGAIAFVVASVVAVAGEVRTYRDIKRR